jgi:hypothetical protein
VADLVHANAPQLVDAWFGLYSQADMTALEKTLGDIAAPNVRYRDRFSRLEGTQEIALQMGAFQRFVGARMERRGDVRHCQGTVLVDWSAVGKDGSQRMSGTSVFTLGASGRIQSVTGLMNPAGA